jgi:hypothetical protein
LLAPVDGVVMDFLRGANGQRTSGRLLLADGRSWGGALYVTYIPCSGLIHDTP